MGVDELTDAQLLKLDRQVCFALYAASRAVTQSYRPALDALGLTYPQYLVMLALWEQDDAVVKELGSRLMLDSGTLTPLLKRLEAGGLITRARDADDERRTRIRLTVRGRRLQRRARAVPESLLCKVENDISLAELTQLRERLHALTARLRNT